MSHLLVSKRAFPIYLPDKHSVDQLQVISNEDRTYRW